LKTVSVSASRSYEIKIGAGLLSRIGDELTILGGAESIVIVSDHTVFPITAGTQNLLYGSPVSRSFLSSSQQEKRVKIPPIIFP